jgi:hypothetical protein
MLSAETKLNAAGFCDPAMDARMAADVAIDRTPYPKLQTETFPHCKGFLWAVLGSNQ